MKGVNGLAKTQRQERHKDYGESLIEGLVKALQNKVYCSLRFCYIWISFERSEWASKLLFQQALWSDMWVSRFMFVSSRIMTLR